MRNDAREGGGVAKLQGFVRIGKIEIRLGQHAPSRQHRNLERRGAVVQSVPHAVEPFDKIAARHRHRQRRVDGGERGAEHGGAQRFVGRRRGRRIGRDGQRIARRDGPAAVARGEDDEIEGRAFQRPAVLTVEHRHAFGSAAHVAHPGRRISAHLRARQSDQLVVLCFEIGAKRHAGIKGAVRHFADAQRRPLLRAKLREPIDQGVDKRRQFETGDVGEQARMVERGVIGRAQPPTLARLEQHDLANFGRRRQRFQRI